MHITLLAVAKNPSTVAKKTQHRPSQKTPQPTHRRKKNPLPTQKTRSPKKEVSWVLGIHIYIYIYISMMTIRLLWLPNHGPDHWGPQLPDRSGVSPVIFMLLKKVQEQRNRWGCYSWYRCFFPRGLCLFLVFLFRVLDIPMCFDHVCFNDIFDHFTYSMFLLKAHWKPDETCCSQMKLVDLSTGAISSNRGPQPKTLPLPLVFGRGSISKYD